MKTGPEIRRVPHQLNACQRTGGDRRRQRGSEDEPCRITPDVINQCCRSRDISSDHAKRLGQRSLDDRNAIGLSVALSDAGASRSVHANGMHFIEKGHRPMVLGDIVVAYETMEREASKVPIPLADHLMHILIHGVLHLCRFDHDNEQDAKQMETLESAILRELGVPDPYSPPSAPKRTAKKKMAKRTRGASRKQPALKASKRNR